MTYAEIEPIETWVKPMKDNSGNFDFTEVDRAQSRNYTQGSKIQMVRVITPAGTSAQEFKLTNGTNLLNIFSDGSLDFETYLLRSGTQIIRNDNSAAAGTRTLYTVTAGKTLYVRSAYITNQPANNSLVQLTTDADGTSRVFLGSQTSSGAGTSQGSNTFSGWLKIPAGKLVQVIVGPNCGAQDSGFVGFEI